MIKKVKNGWKVYSSKGEPLSGVYVDRDDAVKRLRQIEYFKRRSVRAHLRKTRTGKLVPVRRHTRSVLFIDGDNRSVLDDLTSKGVEFGGGIDFENGGVSDFSVRKGNGEFIDLDADDDSLVEYHTHTDNSLYRATPSVEDVLGFMSLPGKRAQLVFYDGGCFVMIKKGDEILSDVEVKEIDDFAVGNADGNPFLLQKFFLQGLNDSGKVDAFVSKSGEDIVLPIDSDERMEVRR